MRERLGPDVPEELLPRLPPGDERQPAVRATSCSTGSTTRAPATLERVGGSAVKETVGHRIASLGAPAVALAQAVAVLGGGAELPVAAELAGPRRGRRRARGPTGSSAAASSSRTRELGFVHPIVRAAVYDELAPGRAPARATRAPRPC